MPIAKRECRVCGREYEACHTPRNATGGFNWREVACSPECGEKYLKAVLEARGTAASPAVGAPSITTRRGKSRSEKKADRSGAENEQATTDNSTDEEAPAPSEPGADDTDAGLVI